MRRSHRTPPAQAAWLCVTLLVSLSATVACLAPEVVEEETEGSHASWSSSIALTPGEEIVWVASPDDDRVVALDATSLEQRLAVDAPDEPTQLALGRNALIVTALQDTQVMVLPLDVQAPSPIRVDVPCGGTRGVAVLPGGTTALLTCPWDDRVVRIDLATAQVTGVWATPRRPTAIAATDRQVFVTLSADGQVASAPVGTFFQGSATDTPQRAGWTLTPVELPEDRALSQLDALIPVRQSWTALGQSVEHLGPRDAPPERGGYGSVVDGDPRIEPWLAGVCAGPYAAFDGGRRVMSGPSALALGPEGWLWVVNQYTQNLALLDCATVRDEAGRRPVQRAWGVGAGARGIAASADGLTVWIDNAFDYSVTRLQVDATGAGTPATVRRTPGTLALSTAAYEGRRAFFDATDTHLTPSGIVACATCHPDGREDGLSWFLHAPGVERKFRRTPSAAVRPSERPMHWDGEFTDAAELTLETIRGLMGGDGLVIDLSDIAAWMEELPPLPGLPISDASAASVEAGAQLFEGRANCVRCHVGDAGTDGLPWALLVDSADPDGLLEAAITPSLRGVRARAPWFHDGRASSLFDAIAMHPSDEGGPLYETLLSAAEIRSLVDYLATR